MMCESLCFSVSPLAHWNGRDYVPLVNLIGTYFQIRDDYMNLQSDQASLCYPYGA
jgi:hypothetical protein